MRSRDGHSIMAEMLHLKLSAIPEWDCPRRALGMEWNMDRNTPSHTPLSAGLVRLFRERGLVLDGVTDGHVEKWAHYKTPRQRVLAALKDLSEGYWHSPLGNEDDVPMFERETA